MLKVDKEKLNFIIKNYHAENQIAKAIEEIRELEAELKGYIYKGKNQKEITEEMADVYVMLEQLKIIFKNEEEIEKVMDNKINRTIERINVGLPPTLKKEYLE